MALARAARENNYVKPELTSEPIIEIKRGRYKVVTTITERIVA